MKPALKRRRRRPSNGNCNVIECAKCKEMFVLKLGADDIDSVDYRFLSGLNMFSYCRPYNPRKPRAGSTHIYFVIRF